MKHAAPVRKELGVRTIFNILGPLTNPAGAPNQLLGVFHPDLVGIQVARAAAPGQPARAGRLRQGRHGRGLARRRDDGRRAEGRRSTRIRDPSRGLRPADGLQPRRSRSPMRRNRRRCCWRRSTTSRARRARSSRSMRAPRSMRPNVGGVDRRGHRARARGHRHRALRGASSTSSSPRRRSWPRAPMNRRSIATATSSTGSSRSRPRRSPRRKRAAAASPRSTPRRAPRRAARFRAARSRARIAAGAPAVIAEIKKASPSKGVLRDRFRSAGDRRELRARRRRLPVGADRPRSSSRARRSTSTAARAACALPALRKDFIVDDYQVARGARAGRRRILLIVAALDDARLAALEACARDYGLAVLVEVHDARRARPRAARSQTPLVGINNRNLRTLRGVASTTTLDLLPRVPPGSWWSPKAASSRRRDVATMRAPRRHAFLVGEAFMRAADPGAALHALFG